MELTVVGSSSKGNCYVIQNKKEALIIEAGCGFADLLKAIAYNIPKVTACLVTHEHGDHSKNVQKLCELGVKCYMSEGTRNGIKNLRRDVNIIKAGNQFTVGRFIVLPFDTHHDSNEPLGYLISHPEFGTLLFAIDTCYLDYTFSGLTNIMIECNYCSELLEQNMQEGIVHPKVGKHIVQGHMSLKTCIQALQANNLEHVNKIILLHLSNDNSDPIAFHREVELATGKTVIVAKQGAKVDLSLTPFNV